MKNLPNITSKWTSIDSSVFKIITLEHKDNQVWVHYKNEKTGQKYSCLVAAFLQRFKEQLA